MKKFKRNFDDWLLKRIELLLLGTKGLNKEESGVVAGRSLVFWRKIRPFLFVFSVAFLIFFYFPKRLDTINILLILVFMIYARIHFFLSKLEKGELKTKSL